MLPLLVLVKQPADELGGGMEVVQRPRAFYDRHAMFSIGRQ